MVCEVMKMATANVTIRMDAELKAAMEKLCAELGMNLTTAFMIFAKKMVGEQAIPFQISRPDPFYSESNMQALREAIKQVDEGKVVYKTLAGLGAME
ncbi:type II toxin-antitoxin system RelB/DinJ family antitoxin [Mobiluncus mulieris]|uniref:type II toxin-antitoxin system RelB/DinJ family antitoxin n=2 Tax=Mobiluncus mulieris TaxID=2052 RepID=UPI0014704756|nr:type II toxin-antitoxin system RelB/DinJ family antitoxin [Mobiluncus mulieris]MCU9971442.1 type II toxin-antitoxin system RelB/DinJ family antitoxin [Mobiluncus mulieris]MCU9996460.1 type II toxin-antitoxin system RelB/DinJ family antitoxin [Mobiluncus mulieris]NMW60608.1 type II toxin-antitoxin system RelB/DinJ family antitoxin [Mobiluncus mulieris]NMW91689.1 type II toxin-antitoxin system RelB/DinJ family antitoxin [Mobiluncus mulieris]